MILPCSIAFITSWFAVSLFPSLLVSAMLNEYRGNLGLFWFCFTTLSDWSKIPSSSLNQPDLIQKLINKINKHLLHLHFSIFFGSFLVFTLSSCWLLEIHLTIYALIGFDHFLHNTVKVYTIQLTVSALFARQITSLYNTFLGNKVFVNISYFIQVLSPWYKTAAAAYKILINLKFNFKLLFFKIILL